MSEKYKTSEDENVLDHDEEQEQRLEPPSQYKVVLVNDDFTPMDFVVRVLQDVFRLDESNAKLVMLEVHGKGKGVAGIYTHEIAETRQAQAMSYAQKNDHPLLVVLEKV